jgi:hypothetical protein
MLPVEIGHPYEQYMPAAFYGGEVAFVKGDPPKMFKVVQQTLQSLHSIRGENCMRKVVFLLTLITFLVASTASAADLTGKWAVNMNSPFGQKESFDLFIKDVGGNLTIACVKHPILKGDLSGTGAVKGDAVTMNLKSVFNGLGINVTGKIEGDKITGTREFISIPPGSFSAMEEVGTPMPARAGAPEGGTAAAGQRSGDPRSTVGVSNIFTAERVTTAK